MTNPHDMTPADIAALKNALGYQPKCEHEELDHGYCLYCGKDCTDDLIGRAEMNADIKEDR